MARSKIARVVDVHPVRDRVEAHLVAQGPEYIEEFGLAVVTPVGCVHPVARVRELLRGHEAVGDAELAGDPLGHRAVARGVRRRFRGNREGIFTRHPVRRIGEITRIDATRERDQQATRGPECVIEGGALGTEIGRDFHGAKVRRGRPAVNTRLVWSWTRQALCLPHGNGGNDGQTPGRFALRGTLGRTRGLPRLSGFDPGCARPIPLRRRARGRRHRRPLAPGGSHPAADVGDPQIGCTGRRGRPSGRAGPTYTDPGWREHPEEPARRWM